MIVCGRRARLGERLFKIETRCREDPFDGAEKLSREFDRFRIFASVDRDRSQTYRTNPRKPVAAESDPPCVGDDALIDEGLSDRRRRFFRRALDNVYAARWLFRPL